MEYHASIDAIVEPIGDVTRRPRRALFDLAGWPTTARVGLAVLGLITLAVTFAPLISPHSPLEQDLTARLQPPSADHWLGTDYLGRDLFSRLLHGGRYCMLLAGLSVAIVTIVGTLIGALSALKGGLFEEIAMRVVDFAIAIPEILIALIIVFQLGNSFAALLLALCFLAWAPYARLVRTLTLDLKDAEYVQASMSVGCSRWFIVSRHIAPNIVGPVMAMSCLGFGLALITVGGLSYLGLGIQPPRPDWGSMLAEGQPYMQRVPMLVIGPGLMIFLTALSFTLLGQGLSAVMDPKQRRR
jgi:ABC-type dipeptide/oligopeptide/nickel transport system permease subunit